VLPLFDLLNALGHLSPDEYRPGKLLPARIGAMLSKLCLQGVACDRSFSGTFTFPHSIPRGAVF
jgi:hypothetical protein